jgi:hypothetical protein
MPTVTRRSFALVLAGSFALAPHAARAQSSAAAAQALFDEGKALMARGDFPHACPKLAESQRIEPSGGTILHLARCHMSEGKTATAWAEFNQALSVARRDGRNDREDAARAHIAALEPKLSRLVVTVDAPGGQIAITRDGESMGRALWGVAVPVDPGSHVIEASARGKKTWRVEVAIVQEGTTQTVHVPALDDAPVSAIAARVPAAATPMPAAAPAGDLAPRATAGSSQRTWALVAGGAGLAGVAVGSVFGLVSKSKHDDAQARCTEGPSGKVCDAEGLALDGEATSAGNLSTVAFVAGGALVATGLVLWFTAPRTDTAPKSGSIAIAPSATPAGAGFLMRGTW